MLRRISFLTTFVLLGCYGLQNNNTDKGLALEVKQLNYGICESRKINTIEDAITPSGKEYIATGFKLVEKTDTIPAVLGKEFGVQYFIKCKRTKNIKVENIWIFPSEIINDKGEKFKGIRYTVSKPTNHATFTSYYLSEEYETKKGEWIFQMYYQDTLLYEKKFILE